MLIVAVKSRRSSAGFVSCLFSALRNGVNDWIDPFLSAPAPVDILYEMRANRPELFEKIEVMVDGGVRSGADVVKALALGAKAVGLGRPFLYANGTHGQEGVERVCQSESEWEFETRSQVQTESRVQTLSLRSSPSLISSPSTVQRARDQLESR
jgi:hypothetical protein